jgi:DnaK suppressor protein
MQAGSQKRKAIAMPKQKKKSEYEHLRELLLRKREELNRRVEGRRKEIFMDPEPEDEVGMALRNSFAGIAVANIEREVRNLAEIELSLRRIQTGEYGTCGLCGEKIPLVRLKAIPWTRCCVECAGGGRSRLAGPSAPNDRGDLLLRHA